MTAAAALRARLRRDEGTAVVEFCVLAVCVLVPLVYAVLTVMRVQSAAYAMTQAAREAGRAYALSPTPAEGERRARVALRLALEGQGLDPGRGRVSIDCIGACLAPGTAVRVTASMSVALPLLPDAVTGVPAGRVPVSATHVAPVDALRVGGPS